MKSQKAFTLIEMLIVIVIIAILSTITLKLNWWQIDDMRAMNEREQRLSWHRKHNNLATNTNYINGAKSEQISFEYYATGITMKSSGEQLSFPLSNQVISWSALINKITKDTLSLGCTANTTTIEFISQHKKSCFTLNTRLCTRTPCSSTN